MTNSFIDIDKISYEDLRLILDTACRVKKDFKSGVNFEPLKGKHLALIFEKPSTRTRVSFEVGMKQLGGDVVLLTTGDSQLGRGEPVSDTAQVLSRYVDIIMIRTFKHETLIELSEHATIPVINGLTDYSHPCQLLTDIMTFEEHRGTIKGKTIAWVGDCNNMANSWIHAAEKFDFTLNMATPEELSPPKSEYVNIFHTPEEAVRNSDCVITDTWVSMGDEDADYKKELLEDFQITDDLMSIAKDGAVFMHCLPAHRDEEVATSVIDGTHSIIFDQAENRLHAQKGILLWCMGKIDIRCQISDVRN